MSGVGTNGGYGVPSTVDGQAAGTDYPPGPSLWLAGQTWPFRMPAFVYAADLNQQLSAAVAFLSRKPMFQGEQDTAQPVASGATVPIVLDTEVSDPWGMHDDDGDLSQVTVPPGTDGIWLVQGSIPYATGAAGHYYSAQIVHTPVTGTPSTISGERLQAAGTRVAPGVADLIGVTAGDVLQLAGFHTTGTALNTWVSTPDTPAVQYADFATPLLTARWVAANASIPGGVIPVQVPAAWDGGTPVMATATVQLGIPDPITWQDELFQATSDQFNSDIRNSVLFLANVPACRVEAVSPGATPNGAIYKITGLQSTTDNWGTWTAVNNTWTAPIDGLYLLYGQVGYPQQASPFSARAELHCTVSGQPVQYAGADAFSAAPAAIVFKQARLKAGDTVQLFGFQNSGAALIPSVSTNTRFFTLWLSA